MYFIGSTLAGRSPVPVLNLVTMLPVYAIMACLICLVPGLAYWGILELAWRHAGPWIRRKAAFCLVGCGAGGLAGVAIGLAILEHGALPYGAVGLFAGLVTAALIHSHH